MQYIFKFPLFQFSRGINVKPSAVSALSTFQPAVRYVLCGDGVLFTVGALLRVAVTAPIPPPFDDDCGGLANRASPDVTILIQGDDGLHFAILACFAIAFNQSRDNSFSKIISSILCGGAIIRAPIRFAAFHAFASAPGSETI